MKKKIEDCVRREKEAKKKDYYKILGLSKDASTDQIKKAYKKLAPKYQEVSLLPFTLHLL